MLARLAEPDVVSCYPAESGPMVFLTQAELNRIRACLTHASEKLAGYERIIANEMRAEEIRTLQGQ
jgi:hypothetical protein